MRSPRVLCRRPQTVGRVLQTVLFGIFGLAAFGGQAFGEITEDERYPPAVRELNGQLTGAFAYTNRDAAGATFDLRPGFGRLRLNRPETENYQGTLSGTVSIPIDRELAARAFLETFYEHSETEGLGNGDGGGFLLGGDVFLRYPKRFEISAGPRYRLTDGDLSADSGGLHALGGEARGRLFLDDFGVGPVDLEVEGNFIDRDVGESGAGRAGRTYAADGGIVLYLADRLALRAGGGWNRTNFEGGRNQVQAVGRGALDVLIPGSPAVTLRLEGLGGELMEDVRVRGQVEPIDRTFYQLGVALNLSFPGADSLVELERYYY